MPSLRCCVALLLAASATVIAVTHAAVTPFEANATAPDEASLSSYSKSKTCRPGPRLAAWQKAGVPFVPFVTLTEAHSGSTWFRTMLNSHPCVRSHGETLRHKNELRDLWKALSKPTKTDDPSQVSVPLYAAGLKGFFAPTGAAGDKQRHDLNPTNEGVYAPVAKFLKGSKAGVVLWLRRNPLDRFLSFAREKEIGAPHCQAKMDCDLNKVQALTFTLDPKHLTTFLDAAVKNDQLAKEMLEAIGRPVLEVRYEDLIGDPAVAKQWWGSVLQFIGISKDDVGLLESDWRRQIVKGHAETVANFAEVKERLTSHRGGLFLPYL